MVIDHVLNGMILQVVDWFESTTHLSFVWPQTAARDILAALKKGADCNLLNKLLEVSWFLRDH